MCVPLCKIRIPVATYDLCICTSVILLNVFQETRKYLSHNKRKVDLRGGGGCFIYVYPVFSFNLKRLIVVTIIRSNVELLSENLDFWRKMMVPY